MLLFTTAHILQNAVITVCCYIALKNLLYICLCRYNVYNIWSYIPSKFQPDKKFVISDLEQYFVNTLQV